MNLEILAKLLVDEGYGALGETIFTHRMDAETTRGIMLRNPLDGVPIDHYLPGYYRSKFQAIVRENTQEAGDTLSKRLQNTLTITNRRFLNQDGSLAMKVNHIYPAQLPITYPRLPGQGIEWSLNFITSFVQP